MYSDAGLAMKRTCLMLVVLLVLLFDSGSADAQQASRATIYAGVGGQGIGLSANAEYRLFSFLAVRAGYWHGFVFVRGGHGPLLAVSLLTHPEHAHHLEAGVGVALDLGNPRGVPLIPGATLGYRYQPVEGGLMFRIAFTPLIGFAQALILVVPVVVPWAGISVGYGF
jgi:hypothetical protein